MAFLTINGVAVNVVDSRREVYRVGGNLERADNGAVRSSGGAAYCEYRFRTGPMSREDGAALRSLIEGRGDALKFFSTTTATSWLWTSRGVPRYSSTNGTPTRQTSGGKWGTYMRMTSSPLGTTTWRVLDQYTDSPWSAVLWAREEVDGPWVHFIVSSSGPEYRNGVQVSATPLQQWVRRSGINPQELTLADWDGAGVADFDDVVFLPYLVPASWAPQVYAFHNAQPWSSLPYVTVGGDLLLNASVKMRGEVGNIDTVNGAFGSFGEAFDFVLMESP